MFMIAISGNGRNAALREQRLLARRAEKQNSPLCYLQEKLKAHKATEKLKV